MKRDSQAQWSRWDRSQQHERPGSHLQIGALAAGGHQDLAQFSSSSILDSPDVNMTHSRSGAALEASLSPATRALHALLWVCLLMCLSADGSWICGKESIMLLHNITKLLGDTTDGTLYTPEDITVCTAENLNCFHTELQVIRWEHSEHTQSLSLLIRYLSQMEKLKLKANSCMTDQPCQPCEGHQEQPVPQFLSKLLELLQRECWLQASHVHSCSS